MTITKNYIKKEIVIVIAVFFTVLSILLNIFTFAKDPVSLAILARPLYKSSLIIMVLTFLANIASIFIILKELIHNPSFIQNSFWHGKTNLIRTIIIFSCIYLGSSNGLLNNLHVSYQKDIVYPTIRSDLDVYLGLFAFITSSLTLAYFAYKTLSEKTNP